MRNYGVTYAYLGYDLDGDKARHAPHAPHTPLHAPHAPHAPHTS